jgi:transposase
MPMYCAIDWAGEKHAAVLQDAAGGVLYQGEFDHTAAGIARWLQRVDTLRQGQPVAVIYEATKHGLIDVLLEVSWIELLPVAPVKTKMLRKLHGAACGKSDAVDSVLLCEYLRLHYAQLCGRYVERDALHRRLRERVDQEQDLIARATASQNRLHALVRRLCPEWDALVGDLEHAVYQQFLLHYAPWDRPRESTLRRFLGTHNVRGEDAVRRLVELARTARALGTDRAFQALLLEQIRAEVRLLAALRTELDRVRADLAALYAALPQAPIYDSFPGIGPKLGPRLAAWFGSAPARHFPSKRQALAYAGQTPLTEQSGKSRFVHKRVCCDRVGRHLCYLWARSCQCLATTKWQHEYLHDCKQRGDEVPTRYRKLGAKLLAIAYRCLCSGQPYNETIFLQHRHHVSLAPTTPA